MSVFKLDADSTAFFKGELEHIFSKTYDIKYPELRAREFVPVSGEADPGATTVTYRQFDRAGKAKIIAGNAKDIPRVEVNGKEFNRPVRWAGIAYGYSLQEIRASAMTGRNLNSQKAAAARSAIEEILDTVACFGSATDGIVSGFLNNSDVTATGVGAGNDWSTLIAGGNAAKIVKQLSDALGRITSDSKGIELADTILVPSDQYMLIATTPFGTNSDKTVLDFILANFKMIKMVEPWYRLDGAGPAGVDRVVVYKRDAMALTQEITSEFEQLPPQEQGLEMVINCIAATAGTAITYPKSMQYVDAV